MLEGFLFYYNFVSANSCGICEEGKRAVARVAGKALAADRLL